MKWIDQDCFVARIYVDVDGINQIARGPDTASGFCYIWCKCSVGGPLFEASAGALLRRRLFLPAAIKPRNIGPAN